MTEALGAFRSRAFWKDGLSNPKTYSLMMSLKQASAELDALRAEFSNLPKEKRYAFRAKFQAYLDTKSEEDKRVVAKAFLQGFEEAIDEGKELVATVNRLKVEGRWQPA